MGQKITLYPAPTGKAVTLSTPRRSNSTSVWGGGNTGGGGTSSPGVSMTLSTRRGQQQIAPEGIAFFAQVSGFDSQPPAPGTVYDSTMHDITYIWDFGDEGQFTSLDRVPTEWKDRNVGYGPFPAHVFPGPGTYTVTCEAHERSSGKQAFASIEVTVQDPEAVFTSATTICVDPDGDFTGAPTTEPANCVTTWAAALTRAGTFAGGADLVRILLRSGKTFNVSATGWFGSNLKNGYVSTWGGSTKAKLLIAANCNPIILQKELRTSGASFSNIEVDGQWDAALPGIKTDAVWSTDPGTLGERRPGSGLNVQGGFVTVYNCNFTAVHGCYVGRANQGGITAIISNMASQGWLNFGWYLDSESTPNPTDPLTNYYALVGCRVTQEEQATMGGNSRSEAIDYLDNQHGPVRIQTCAYAYVDALEGFSRNGWGSPGTVPEEQAVLRDCRNDQRSRGYFSRIMGEGGFELYTKKSAADSDIIYPCNGVLDKFMHLGGARSIMGIEIAGSATTVRNGVLQRANTKTGPNGYDRSMWIGPAPKLSLIFPTAGNEPTFVYNVTLVNEANNTNQLGSWTPVDIGAGVYADGMVQVGNLIIHRPNHSSVNTADAPLDAARLGFAARGKGWRWKGYPPKTTDKLTMDASYANPVDPWSFYRPQTGSPAIASATTGKVAYDDLLGNVRPAQASRGGIEPA